MAPATDNPWLVLIHQVPRKPAGLRVKIWRRLQALGAVPIKNAVYVLPNTDESREDFEWVLREIQQDGGEGSLCEARLVEGLNDDEVRSMFVAARESDYRELATDIRRFAHQALPRGKRRAVPEPRATSTLARFAKRLTEIGAMDFFGAPGRETVEGLLRDLDEKLGDPRDRARSPAPTSRRVGDVQGRVWVTRSGVHIDRIASAWLIRRFIDPRGTVQVRSGSRLRARARGAALRHVRRGIHAPGRALHFRGIVARLRSRRCEPAAARRDRARHRLKEAKFGRPETAGVEHLIAGIAWTHPDDEQRLADGATVFDALHGYFKKRKS